MTSRDAFGPRDALLTPPTSNSGGSKPPPPMGAKRYFSPQTHTFALSTPPTTLFYTFFTSFTYISHAKIKKISGTSKWGVETRPSHLFFSTRSGAVEIRSGGSSPLNPPGKSDPAPFLHVTTIMKEDCTREFTSLQQGRGGVQDSLARDAIATYTVAAARCCFVFCYVEGCQISICK